MALTIFQSPLLQDSLSPEGRHLMETFLSGLSVPRFLTLCTLPSSLLIPIYCRWKLLCCWWSKILIFKYSRMSLGVIYCYIPLVNISIWFSPRSQAYLISGSRSPEQYQGWVLSHKVGPKSDQILVGYSHKPYAIITLAHLAGTIP